jgi:hypothetical protein
MSPRKPPPQGVTGALLPSPVLVMNERQLLRNASKMSSGNGCAPLPVVRSHFVLTCTMQLADRVKKMAGKTHKDRVHEFNSKLEALSEHHDIPKVNIPSNFSAPHLINSSIRLALDKVGVEPSGVSPRSSFLPLRSGPRLSLDVVRIATMFWDECQEPRLARPRSREMSRARVWMWSSAVVLNICRVPGGVILACLCIALK